MAAKKKKSIASKIHDALLGEDNPLVRQSDAAAKRMRAEIKAKKAKPKPKPAIMKGKINRTPIKKKSK